MDKILKGADVISNCELLRAIEKGSIGIAMRGTIPTKEDGTPDYDNFTIRGFDIVQNPSLIACKPETTD